MSRNVFSKTIGRVFYETRALMGREFTVRRFAREVLEESVDEAMLGYIEKGKRFPTEPLVRRLAVLRKEAPEPLLALLWRDRMVHGFQKELARVVKAPKGVGGIEDADLAVLTSQAIAALPRGGESIDREEWITAWSKPGKRVVGARPVDPAMTERVIATLLDRGIIEQADETVRKAGDHYIASGDDERFALAVEFCALFSKSLLDKLVIPDVAKETYVRNHFTGIAAADIPAFQKELDSAVATVVRKYAAEEGDGLPLLNVLVNATTV